MKKIIFCVTFLLAVSFGMQVHAEPTKEEWEELAVLSEKLINSGMDVNSQISADEIFYEFFLLGEGKALFRDEYGQGEMLMEDGNADGILGDAQVHSKIRIETAEHLMKKYFGRTDAELLSLRNPAGCVVSATVMYADGTVKDEDILLGIYRDGWCYGDYADTHGHPAEMTYVKVGAYTVLEAYGDDMYHLSFPVWEEGEEYTIHIAAQLIDEGAESYWRMLYCAETPPEADALARKVHKQTDAEISVYVDGERLTFDQPPIIEKNRTLVPLRAIFEALHAKVDWDGETRTVYAKRNATDVSLTVGMDVLYKNNKKIALDVASQIVNNRTLVPLRAVSEALGCTVEWNGRRRAVIIEDNPGIVLENQASVRNVQDNTNHNYTGVQNHYIYGEGNRIWIVMAKEKTVEISAYDKNTYEKTDEMELPFELPLFGGFFAGEKYNYLVFGQENMEEDDSKEVIRIVKYDKSFNRLDSLAVRDAYTTIPFHAATPDMAEYGDEVILHTARQRYLTPDDGLRHQSNLLIIFDSETMTLKNELGEFQGQHVGHSFNQFVRYRKTGDYVLLDHGDAYPRSVVAYDWELMRRYKAGEDVEPVSYALKGIGGEIGDNYTGLTVGGFAVTDETFLATLNEDCTKTHMNPRHALLTVCTRADMQYREVELQNCRTYGESASAPYLVELSENRFFLIWKEFAKGEKIEGRIVYTVVDGFGNRICENRELINGELAKDCQPVLHEDTIYWYVNRPEKTLYTINVSEFLQ